MSRHFLIIGAQRCGTSWLRDQLDLHPQVAMARPAHPEPKAFLREHPPGLQAYRAEFFSHAGPELALGEKSTSYLESAEAPTRVATSLGRPKIVVQLRDPVARAVSHWSFSRDHGMEQSSLEEALRADLVQPRPWDRARSSVSPFAYVSRGHYIRDLVRWTEHFDVYVSFVEELSSDPDRMSPLLRWLGVDDTFRPSAERASTNSSTAITEPLDPRLQQDLREHYADSDAALAGLVNRSLPWPTHQPA